MEETEFKRLESSVVVDKHKLDEEFERHPQNLWSVADALAESHRERAEAKLQLERTEARVRGEQLAKADGAKMTDKSLAALVALDPDVRRKEAQLMDEEHQTERLAGLLMALQSKTSALKHLSELAQVGYYVSATGRKLRERVRDDD